MFQASLFNPNVSSSLSPDPNGHKLVHVREETLNLTHYPVEFCNKLFVTHQRDVRQTVDIRYLTYSVVGPNGQLIPLNEVPDVNVFPNMNAFPNLNQVIENACKINLQQVQFNSVPQPMEVDPPKEVATIAQQLQWNTLPIEQNPVEEKYPFKATFATSTTEIRNYSPKPCRLCGCRGCCRNKRTVSKCRKLKRVHWASQTNLRRCVGNENLIGGAEKQTQNHANVNDGDPKKCEKTTSTSDVPKNPANEKTKVDVEKCDCDCSNSEKKTQTHANVNDGDPKKCEKTTSTSDVPKNPANEKTKVDVEKCDCDCSYHRYCCRRISSEEI